MTEVKTLSLEQITAVTGEVEDLKSLTDVMNEFNGAYESSSAGTGGSYIPRSHFVHLVVDEGVVSNAAGVQLVELFYNWLALGKSVGALIAAAIRYEARESFVLTREVTILREAKIDAKHAGDLKSFTAMLKAHNKTAALWAKQWISIAAMNGACLIAIGHHWDATNLKAWKSLCQSLGQQDVIDEDSFRTIFYLALHPLPLAVLEHHRAAAAKLDNADYVAAVSLRARCVPATLGAFMACSSAIPDLAGETFYKYVPGSVKESLTKMRELSVTVRSSPARFCPLAALLGTDREVLDVAPFKSVMVILAAYIYECVQATLMKSAALKKWSSQSARSVKKWRDLFAKFQEEEASSLKDALIGLGTVDEVRKSKEESKEL